jgi:hypothetical protein
MTSNVDWDLTMYDNVIADICAFYDAEAEIVHHNTFDDLTAIAMAQLPPITHILGQNIYS